MISLANLKIPVDEFDPSALLAHWSLCVPKHYLPLFLSTFGDWFFRDPDDRVYMLDLVAGELKQIADSVSEFEALLELEEYQREWLMSHLAQQLHQSGVTRGRGQCYAFRTPPMLGGQLSPSNIVVCDLGAYQAGTAKIHRGVGGLPPGTEIIAKS